MGDLAGIWDIREQRFLASNRPDRHTKNVNLNEVNHYTLHASAGIIVTNYTGTSQKGPLAISNCNVNAPDQDRNGGCFVTNALVVPSYNTKFNENGGGVFATLIDGAGIQI